MQQSNCEPVSLSRGTSLSRSSSDSEASSRHSESVAEKKLELDSLLDTAKTTLHKLEEIFTQNVDIGPHIIHCFKEILRIHKNCRQLDRMMSATYFDEEALVDVMASIRAELKVEKTFKIAKQVMRMISDNCERMAQKTTEEAVECKENGEGQGDSKVTDPKSEDQTGRCEGAQGRGEPAECPKLELAEDISTDFSRLSCHSAAGDDSNGRSSESASTKEDKSSTRSSAERVVESPSEERARAAKAKELCQQACHLLRQQIIQVHSDLESKWARLTGMEANNSSNCKSDAASGEVANKEATDKEASQATGFNPPLETPSQAVHNDGSPVANSAVSDSPRHCSRPQPNLELAVKKCIEDCEGGGSTEEAVEALLRTPLTPQTPAEIRAKLEVNVDGQWERPEKHILGSSATAPCAEFPYTCTFSKFCMFCGCSGIILH